MSDLFKGGSGALSGLCHREQSVAVSETFLHLCCLGSDPADSSCERRQCECSSAPPACLSRGKLLLHCFLQGLKAGLNEGTGERTPSVSETITTVQTFLRKPRQCSSLNMFLFLQMRDIRWRCSFSTLSGSTCRL